MTVRSRRRSQIALAAIAAVGLTSFAAAARNVIAAFDNPIDGYAEKAKLQTVAADLGRLMHDRGYDRNLGEFRPFPTLSNKPLLERVNYAGQGMAFTFGGSSLNGGAYAPSVNGGKQSLVGPDILDLNVTSRESGIKPFHIALLIAGHEAGHMIDINSQAPDAKRDANKQEAYGDIAGIYLIAHYEGTAVARIVGKQWQDFRSTQEPCHDTSRVLDVALNAMSAPKWQKPVGLSAVYNQAKDDFPAYYAEAAGQQPIAAACKRTAYGKASLKVSYAPR